MRYRLLGPLRVESSAGVRVEVGPPKQRAVLAALLLARGRVVSVDRLIDAVWGDDVPGSATASLQAYVSNLRRALRDDGTQASPIVRQAPGYYLAAGPDDVDLNVFATASARTAAAVGAASWELALTEADTALALWRGPFLEDLYDEPWVTQDATQAEETRRECRDNRITALLALGRVPAALAEASQLSAADPLSDRACWLHVMALYRSGRTPDALEAVTRYIRVLDEELGLTPGVALRDLQSAVLRHAPELAAWPRQPGWTGANDVAAPAIAASVPSEIAAAPRGEIVGRERELSAIAELLADAATGAARWLVLSGPAGIGKTRLAEEVAASVTADDGRVVWVNCPDEAATPPWWPMRQLVRALGGDADEVLQVPPNADPDTARFLVYERIQRLLQSVDHVRTVVVDDVQWADSASTSCLAYFAGALRDRPLVLVLTVRDGEHTPELRRLLATVARGARNRHIEVPALSSRDVAALATQVADDEVSDEEAAGLAERTGGNPFFVSEYARLPRGERTGGDMPVAVKSVLDRRLAGLDPAVLAVLRTAAVIGDAVDVAVLARATRLGLETLADYLDEAADERIVVTSHAGDGYVFAHGLLREHLSASMPALRRRRLHAAVAEVLAEVGGGADALTRRAQHLVAAQPLVEPGVVVDACRLAAEEATAKWSSDIAAGWWQAALDAYDHLPASARDDVDRDTLMVAMLEAHSRAGRGRLVLGTVEHYLVEALRAGRAATTGRVASALLRASGGWPWLAPGHDPGELLVLLDRATAIAGDDAAAGARVYAALAVGHCYHPDQATAAGYLDRAEALAQTTRDEDVIADVLVGRLITYSGVATLSRKTLEWSDRLNSLQHSRFQEDRVLAHSVSTMAAMNLGDVAEAERRLQGGIEGSEQLQLPVLRAQLRWMEAVLAAWCGDFAEAERHHGIAAHVHEQTELYEAGSGLLATVSLLRDRGGPPPPAWSDVMAGDQGGGQGIVGLIRTALLTLEAGPDARAAAQKTLEAWLDHGGQPDVWTTLGHNTLLAHLAADHALSRFSAPLLETLASFGDCIAVIGQVGVVGPVALATARLHLLTGARAAAQTDLARAVAIAERSAAGPTLVRCQLLAAQLIESGPERRAAAAAAAADARRLGMAGVEAAALELT